MTRFLISALHSWSVVLGVVGKEKKKELLDRKVKKENVENTKKKIITGQLQFYIVFIPTTNGFFFS